MTIHDIPRAQDGFTFVELLVATAMALVVFAVTLSTLSVFNDTTQTLTHRNDSQNQARLAIDQIVRQLRNVASQRTTASFVERATPYDLVFQTVGTPSGTNTLGIERVRYCVPADPAPGSVAHEALIAQVQTWSTSTTPANPWPQGALGTLYPCPDPAYGSSVVVGHVTNRYQGADRSLFTYNGGTAPSDLTTIKSIGFDLFVNTTAADANNQSELRSSAWLRNAQQPPVAAFTWSKGTSGSVVLNAGASYSPSGDTLSYAWSCAPVTCSSSASTFGWSPGASATPYTVTLTVTDQAGFATSVQHTVAVS